MGYDVKKVVGSIERELLCCKCKQVLDNPVKTSCGHLCCKSCLKIPQASDGNTGGYLLCCKCGAKFTKHESEGVSKEVRETLEKVTMECCLGCQAVMPLKELASHMKSTCQLRLLQCMHRGCMHQCPANSLDKHMGECDYRLVECEVCKARICHRDMPAHHAVKQCYLKQLKSKRVASARKLSGELKDHRMELQQQKHVTDQVERKMLKNHYENQKIEYFMQTRRRAQSANAAMTQSIRTRVGSASLVAPKYSRTLSQTTPLSCLTCENKFLSGRRPSARRHSHAKV